MDIARFFRLRIWLGYADEGEGRAWIQDQGGFVMTRAEWKSFKARVDDFYTEISDAEIDRHNEGQWPENRPKPTMPAVEPKPKQPRPGYIYLMHGIGTSWYKIGKSINPDARTKQLGTQGPFDIELLGSWKVDDMDKAESYWHQYYMNRRAGGEWFTLWSEDVEYFTSKVGEG